jgi:hypothetical protein
LDWPYWADELLVAASMKVYVERIPVTTRKRAEERTSRIKEIRVRDPAMA